MTVVPFSPKFKKATLTPFERDVTVAFETYKGKAEYGYLFVTLDYDPTGPYNAAKEGQAVRPASLDIFPIDRDEDPMYAMQFVNGVFGAPRDVIMVLDLHGAALAEQIPDWKAGTHATPARFIKTPVIAAPPCVEDSMSDELARFISNDTHPAFTAKIIELKQS